MGFQPAMMDVQYLKHELARWMANDSSALNLLEGGALDGVWCWDLEVPGRKWFSSHFWRCIGVEAADGLSISNWEDWVQPDEREAVLNALMQATNDTGFNLDRIIRYRHANGSTVWKHSRGVVIRNENGKAIRLMGVDRDLTPLMNLQAEYADRVAVLETANRQLEKEQERFRSLVESAPDAVVITDKHGKIILVNAQTEKLFGYVRKELIGLPVETLIPQRYRGHHPDYRHKYHEAPHARPMGSGKELFGLKKSGEEFPVEISLNVMETDEGRLVSAAIRDVTAQKAAAEEIKNANARLTHQADALEKSNLELQHFAYVVSHDLQTPLRSISGFVQLLQQEYGDKLDEQAVEWIRRTVLGTQRMQTLIRDIMAYSRVETRVHRFTRLSLNEVFAEAVDVLADSIRESNARVNREELPEVLADRPQMVQLLQNLIGNAIKYKGEVQPQVTVSGADQGIEWQVTVKDNGIGIASEHFQRIFDVFQRLHTQKAIPGTGIGLSICRRVVLRHGGRIWVESEPGKGSSFHFTIPKSEGENL